MRGLLYSILAAMMIVPLLGLIFYNSMIGQSGIDMNIRANELKYFADSVEGDLERFVVITGRRAMISAVSNVTVDGVPLDDSQLRLVELAENGTLMGSPAPLVSANNLNTWKEKIGAIAKNSGFNTSIENVEINVTQSSGFEVTFQIKAQIRVSDIDSKMGVIRNVSVSENVSVEGLEDPLMPMNTMGKITRIIKRYDLGNFTKDLVFGPSHPVSGGVSGIATLNTSDTGSQKILIINDIGGVPNINLFGGVVSESSDHAGLSNYIVEALNAFSTIPSGKRIYLDYQTGKVWDLENLTSFVNGYYYKESSTGPSFLDRLEGRLNLSSKYPEGLETMANIHDMELSDLPVNYQYSCVDYKYFGNVTGSAIRNGNYDPIFAWLRIDSASEESYGLGELA